MNSLSPQRMAGRARATIATVAASALALSPITLRAGDLNTEVNNMFNSLGAIGNYTAPGAFRGQTFNTYTGGSLFMRAPNKVYQLAAIQFPSAKAGCGGIDVFGGSFSHISAAEFKNMLRNITAALPGIAFQLALESVSPLLGGLTKWAKGLETWINNARINSCETAKAIVSTAAEAAGYSSQEACADLAIETGLESDRDAARRRCATDRTSILATARSSGDANVRNKAPFVGNLTWKALQRTVPPRRPGARTDHEHGRHGDLPRRGGRRATPSRSRRPSPRSASCSTARPRRRHRRDPAPAALQRLRQLRRGDAEPGLHAHAVHGRVETMMRSIADKIATRAAIPNNSAEVGFVNQTTEPVYKMLSIGATIPGSGLSDSLIGQYRDVIAADYAYVFLERNLRVGMAALDKDYTLQQTQRDLANHVRQRAQAMLLQLSQEKNLLYQKVGSFRAVSSHLEQLERQLRSSMPQHVMDMLGQQAAFLSR
jgi:conjugative transfer pilus assembly protein TraH